MSAALSPAAQQVAAALDAVAGGGVGTQASALAAAQEFLVNVASSDQAWDVSRALLLTSSLNYAFYGAQTLQSNISRHWPNLSSQVKAEVVDFVFERLSSLSRVAGCKVVVRRLATAVAAMVVYEVPSGWPSPFAVVRSKLEACAAKSNNASSGSTADGSGGGYGVTTETGKLVLETTRIVVEELGRVNIDESRLAGVRHAFLSEEAEILSYLNGVTAAVGSQGSGTAGSEAAASAFAFLQAWIEFGASEAAVFASPLLPLAFDALSAAELFPLASELLETVLSMCLRSRHDAAFSQILPKVAGLDPLFSAALAANANTTAAGVARLVVACVSATADRIVAHCLSGNCSGGPSDPVFALLSLLLKCSATPVLVVSEATGEAWLEIQQSIYDTNTVVDPSSMFGALFGQLFEALRTVCVYPPNYDSLDELIKHDFRLIRRDAGDTMLICLDVLHKSATAHLAGVLVSSVEAAQSTGDWRDVESVLFAAACLTESLEYDESGFVQGLFGYLATLPVSDARLQQSAVRLVAATAFWLTHNHDQAAGAAMYLAERLGHPSKAVQAAAAAGLRDVSGVCGEPLVPVLAGLVSGVGAVFSTLSAPQQMLCLESLGFVMSEAGNAAGPALLAITAPILEIAQANCGAVGSTDSRSALVHAFQLLRAAVRFVDASPTPTGVGGAVVHPVITVLEQTWQTIEVSIGGWMQDEVVAMYVWRFVCAALESAAASSGPVLEYATTLAVKNIQGAPAKCGPALEAVAVCVRCNSFVNPQLSIDWSSPLVAIATAVVPLLPTGDSIRHLPEVTKQLMSYLTALARYQGVLLLWSQPYLDSFMAVALMCIGQDHRYTVTAALAFLCEVFSEVPSAEEEQGVAAALARYGPSLVEAIFRGVAGAIPRSMLSPLCDLLHGLIWRHPLEARPLIETLLSTPGVPSQRLTAEEQAHYRTKILTIKSKAKLRRYVNELSAKSRGLDSTLAIGIPGM